MTVQAAPRAVAPPVGGAAPALRRVLGRTFRERGGYAFEPTRLQIIADHAACFGLPPLDPAEVSARLDAGGQHSFIAMSEELVAAAAPLPDLQLVILAHETPDLDLSSSAASYLAYRCPGEIVAFAVSDQGVGAPFTALRIYERMLAAEEAATAAVFVFDQTTLPIWDDRLHGTPVHDAGVMLLLEPADEADLALHDVREIPVAQEDVAEALAERRAELPAERATVVLGSTLEKSAEVFAAYGDEVRTASVHHLCTATWLELTDEAVCGGVQGLLVAEYEASTERLHIAGFLREGP